MVINMKKIISLVASLLISGTLFASDSDYPNVRQESNGTYSLSKSNTHDSQKISNRQSSEDFYEDDFFGDDEEFFDESEYEGFTGRDATKYAIYGGLVLGAVFVVSNPGLLFFL
jgi:hypothetical protein